MDEQTKHHIERLDLRIDCLTKHIDSQRTFIKTEIDTIIYLLKHELELGTERLEDRKN